MCACATFYVDNAVALAVMGKCVHHYLLLNVLLTCFVAWSAAADGSGCSDLCTCFGDYDPSATSCDPPMEEQSQNSNPRLFIETESKVICSGTLSRLQVHFYTQLTGVQEEDGDQKRVSRNRDRNCNWNAEFGLFRRNNMDTDEFQLVEGSSSSPQSSITNSTSCQIHSMDFSYPDPRPTVKAGDHLVVLIRMRDSGGPCVVQPFPLSFSAGNVNQAFDELSNVRFNSSAVEDMSAESISFDARIQLTDPGKCTDECCTPSQQERQSLCPPIDLRPTPTTTILSVSPSLDVALNVGPTVGVPVAAIPFLALGPVIIALTILLLVYLVWKRKNRRPLKRSRGSNRASNSSISARNLSCSVAANIDSYRDPADAVVIMETSNHTHTGCTTTIRNYLTADYSVEEDPYQDPESLLTLPEDQDTSNKTMQPTFKDMVTNHSYALLYQSPQCTGQQFPQYKSSDTEPGAWQYTTPASSEDELLSQLKELSVREISLDHIEILDERLGIGQFGVVRRGVWSVGGEEREVAVKSLADGSTEEKRIQFLQEAAIMGQFKHPSIISLHGIVTTTQMPLIVLEILVKGDLKRHLSSLKPKRHWQAVSVNCPGLLLSYCRQVAAGMAYLQSREFVHRDLAARNILISCDDVCKIADFGLARHLCNAESHSGSRTGRIPVRWTAPEAIQRREFTSACDVWSFGVLVWEIWSLGSRPYTSLSDSQQVLRKLAEGYRMAPPPGCPSSVYKLMVDCWHTDPGQRPSFAKVLQSLQHPDFKLLTWTAEDVAAYTEEARTLGAPLEAGEELFIDLQQFYIH